MTEENDLQLSALLQRGLTPNREEQARMRRRFLEQTASLPSPSTDVEAWRCFTDLMIRTGSAFRATFTPTTIGGFPR